MEPERSIAAGAAAPAQGSSAVSPPVEVAKPPTAAAGSPSAAPRRRGRVVVAAALLLLVGIGALLASGALSGGDGGEQPPAGETSTQTGAEPARGEVESLVQTFADVYGSKDPDGLARLLAPDFMGRQDGDTQDREGTVAEYRRDVRKLQSPALSLELGSVRTKKGEADVAGRYVLTAENKAPEGGTINFHVVKIQATLLIDEINIDPS